MDWMSPSDTYYTFVDSGVFTMAYTTVNHADERGLQITSTGTVSMSSSTFDFAAQEGELD